jgi:hypothetical protein
VTDLVQAIGQDLMNEAAEKIDRRDGLGALSLGAEGDGTR